MKNCSPSDRRYFRRKCVGNFTESEVRYDDAHWRLLRNKREEGVTVLEILNNYGIHAFIFGSVARGDVTPKSDIEIVVPHFRALNRLEIILKSTFPIEQKVLVMATTYSAPRLHFDLGDNILVVIPLTPLSRLEQEFYTFGGFIELPFARDYRKRVKGVNKDLCLIIPTEWGHREESVVGREAQVAATLGVSIDIVRERIQMLTRRDTQGRSGLYINMVLDPDEDAMKILRFIANRNPEVRRLLKERKVYL